MDGLPWLHALTRRPTKRVLKELATRYRRAPHPATPEDLVTWSGLPLGTTRTAWHLTPPSPKPPATDPFVRLIPAFDEYLLAWPTRTPILAEEHTHHIYPGGGILRPAVLMNGLIRGTWKRTGTKAELDSSDTLPPSLTTPELTDIHRFLT